MDRILTSLNKKLNEIEGSRFGILQIFVIIVFFYILFTLPKILVLNTFHFAVFPLETIYMANNLLLPEGMLNHDLVNIVMTPSNAMFIYPPGIYFLTYFLESVKNIYLFLFFIQLFVPILVYRLFRSFGSSLASFLFSILCAYYLTNANWWSPDHIIQPLLIIGLLILMSFQGKNGTKGLYRIIGLGLVTGIIIILKQTVGIFWGGVVVSFLLFQSIENSQECRKKKDRIFLFMSILVFFVCGLYFLSKQIFLDEVVYYLFPYFTFWGLITYYVLENNSIGFNRDEFLKNTFSFLASALIFPAIVFIYMGETIGYAHYSESFAMGLPYLPIWDHGIAGTIESYATFQRAFTLESIFNNYYYFTVILMILLPFAVNCLINMRLFHLIRNGVPSSELNKYFKITSISILSILMVFPLESYHILSTKLFIFLFILLYLLKDYSLNLTTSIKLLMLAMIIPGIAYSIHQSITLSDIETSYGTEHMKNVIGMPIEMNLADEIETQLAIIRRTTQGAPYYVIDTTGATLPWLMAIENNKYPEYYLEIRKGIMNKEVTEAIKISLQQVPFVVVDDGGYQKYLNKEIDDPYHEEILDFVNKNFVLIDRYEEPEEKKPSFSLIQSFIIMKKIQKPEEI